MPSSSRRSVLFSLIEASEKALRPGIEPMAALDDLLCAYVDAAGGSKVPTAAEVNEKLTTRGFAWSTSDVVENCRLAGLRLGEEEEETK